MLGATIVGISTLLQFAAAFVALRLMHITGKSISWGLISLAIFLMAIRRSATLLKIMQGQQAQPFDFSIELIALLISILMFAGLILISPLFKSMNINMAMLKKTRQDPGLRVVEHA